MAIKNASSIREEAFSLVSYLGLGVVRPEIDELARYGGHIGKALAAQEQHTHRHLLTVSPDGSLERITRFRVASHKGSGFSLHYALNGEPVEKDVRWCRHPTIAIADETMLREFPLLGTNYRAAVLLTMDAPGNHGAREFPALYLARK